MTMTKMTTFVTFPELVSFPDAVDSLFTGYVDIFLKRLTTFSGCIGNHFQGISSTFSVWMSLYGAKNALLC